MQALRLRNGFTIIELLIVVGIIGVLAAIIIVAINPQRQISQSRNAQRQSDVNTILNAIYQYALDNEGDMPTGVTSIPTEICRTAASSCFAGVDLDVLSGTYLPSIPIDPVASITGTGTDYLISQDSHGRITIQAENAELGIAVSR